LIKPWFLQKLKLKLNVIWWHSMCICTHELCVVCWCAWRWKKSLDNIETNLYLSWKKLLKFPVGCCCNPFNFSHFFLCVCVNIRWQSEFIIDVNKTV
jgi:hypothetical protein